MPLTIKSDVAQCEDCAKQRRGTLRFRDKLISRLEPASTKNRILPMEGIRGVAATLVFFVHFNSHFTRFCGGGSMLWMAQWMGSMGHTGVDVFFILSGYLIYGITMKPRFAFWPYFERRVARLYPTFLLVFAIYLGTSFVLPSRSKLPSSVPHALLYVAANLLMLPGIFPIRALITVAWSLSYEWLFYLVLPALILLLRLRRWQWRFRILFASLVSVFCVWAGQEQFTAHSRLGMFGAGLVVWELLHRTEVSAGLPRWGEWVAGGLFVLNLAVIGAYGAYRGSTEVVLARVPAFYVPSLWITGGLLVLYAIGYPGVLGRTFSVAPLRWIGNISYSYYLIHGLTLISLSVIVGRTIGDVRLGPAWFLVMLVACYAATLTTALTLYLCVEWPLSLSSGDRTAHHAAAKTILAEAMVGGAPPALEEEEKPHH